MRIRGTHPTGGKGVFVWYARHSFVKLGACRNKIKQTLGFRQGHLAYEQNNGLQAVGCVPLSLIGGTVREREWSIKTNYAKTPKDVVITPNGFDDK